jgi:hypothetical protein
MHFYGILLCFLDMVALFLLIWVLLIEHFGSALIAFESKRVKREVKGMP